MGRNNTTLALKQAAERNPAEACDTVGKYTGELRCANHLDFPKRPYGFVCDAGAARVSHP